MKALAVLALTFVVFAYIKQAEGIYCYDCNSNLNASCEDVNLLEQYKKNCNIKQIELNLTRPYTMCRKIKITVDYSMNGLPPTDRIIRTCGWDESNYKGACYRRTAAGEKQMVCSCLTDYCNVASSHVPFITLLAAVFTILMFKFI